MEAPLPPAVDVPLPPAVDLPLPPAVELRGITKRFGVIEAAQENGLLAVGNMSDQQELAPENVVTSVTWNMTPTVDYVIDQVAAGAYTAQDLKDFSMVAKGGAALAPINAEVEGGIPDDLMQQVQDKQAAITDGTFRVDITESAPPGSVIPPSE